MTREEAIKFANCLKNNYTIDFDDMAGFCDEAIRALEQEPCEDCVSREAVLETIDDCNRDGLKGIFCSYDDGERFKKYIKNLPPVAPTRKWIPCSERMPEVGEKVLCQCQANIYEVLKLTFNGWYHDNDNEHCYMLGFVIAWMPLPDSYEPEREGD